MNITTNGAASINMSVELNGTVYTGGLHAIFAHPRYFCLLSSKLTDLRAAGMLFAQKPAAPVVSQTVTAAGTSGFSALSSSHSPTSSSSTSSKGPN